MVGGETEGAASWSWQLRHRELSNMIWINTNYCRSLSEKRAPQQVRGQVFRVCSLTSPSAFGCLTRHSDDFQSLARGGSLTLRATYTTVTAQNFSFVCQCSQQRVNVARNPNFLSGSSNPSYSCLAWQILVLDKIRNFWQLLPLPIYIYNSSLETYAS